eukprot:scaffold16304_cov117-Isochrysis_galbana.AAC.6
MPARQLPKQEPQAINSHAAPPPPRRARPRAAHAPPTAPAHRPCTERRRTVPALRRAPRVGSSMPRPSPTSETQGARASCDHVVVARPLLHHSRQVLDLCAGVGGRVGGGVIRADQDKGAGGLHGWRHREGEG